MPGANCSIYGCSTSRRSSGIAIFKVPSGDDPFNKAWREKIIAIVKNDRVIDANLKEQIAKKLIHTCELHYPEEKLLRNIKKTTLIPGSLPTLNLPTKSIPKSVPVERSSLSIEKRAIASSISSSLPSLAHKDCYKSFDELFHRALLLKLPNGWGIEKPFEELIKVCFNDSQHIIPKYEIYINKDLGYKILVYNWQIPDSNTIVKSYQKSMKYTTLSNLIADISKLIICGGISISPSPKSEKLVKHIVPKLFSEFSLLPLHQTEYLRPSNCLVLNDSLQCSSCVKFETHFKKTEQKNLEKSTIPIKPQAPISLTSPERVKVTLQHYRIQNKELQLQIKVLQKELESSSVKVSSSLNEDFQSIISNADQSKLSPFMKLFWSEQQKYLNSTSPSGIRYHPMIIRYCLSLAAKSAAAYDEIRYDAKTGTGFVVLPSRRRLRDYKNYIRPQRGFNPDIIKELKQKVEDFSDAEKYIVILFDEMKIQENLVWDKHSGELIGYVDLGDPTLNYASFQKQGDIATHILVFMIRSIINPFKFSLANFATKDITASQIFPLFWKAVSICELQCNLKVIATTSDGASSNRKFFKMHFHLLKEEDKNPDADVVYKTPNLFSTDKRYIYFISDAPHLMKTARNCLLSSGFGKFTRIMWNDGGFLLWNHITDIFYEDRNCGLHLLPKLTFEHIKLTPYSKMNVKLAAQVLSSSVSKVLNEFGPPEAASTAEFCSMMDSFFDIVNVRSPNEYKNKQKPFLAPFSTIDDSRFSWLRNVFLKYFEDWNKSISNRPGNYSSTDRSDMFISRQTYEGIKITVYSIIECLQFLLNDRINGYILTERFCQDPLENYFGHQRSMGSRKDNPPLRDIGYNDNTIRNQKIFRPIAAGNVTAQSSISISDEPMPCRKKPLI